MFPVVFVLLLIITSTTCSGERQEILLEYESSTENGVTKLRCKTGEFYLRDALPTVIILKTTQTVWHHECYANGQWWNVTKFNKINNGAEGIVNEFLVGEINEQHYCTFRLHKNINFIEPQVQLADGNYTELNCSFTIHMKYNWKNLTLKINSEQAKTIPVLHNAGENISQEVDLQYTYEFVENELIKVQCNQYQERGLLYFVYSGNDLNYSSVKKYADDVSFEVILGTKQNNSHVDCIFSKKTYNVTLRTKFFLKNREAIRVNGLAIRGKAENLTYEYYGKLPSVVCPGTESDAELIQHRNEVYDALAVCSVEGENKTVLIKKMIPHNGLLIEGLSMKNMLFKSCDEPSCKTYYKYADGDVITLNSSVNFTCDRNDSLTSDGVYTLQMKSDVNMTHITCFIPGNESLKTTLIFFVPDKAKEVLKPGITAGNDSTNVYSENSNNTASGSNSDPHKKSAGDDSTKVYSKGSNNIASDSISDSHKGNGGGGFFKHPITAVVGIVLFIIIFLLVLTSIVCVLRKRKKPTTEGVQADVDYVNLGHKNNEQFPKRLNEHVYLNPQESSDYAVPVDNSVDTTLYSVPYKKPTEELYSKPVPKNQRGYVNHEEVQYAAITFNKPRDKNTNDSDTEYSYAYAQVHVRPEDLYAKVQPKAERNNTSPQNCADYVEPSYCEIGAFRK